MRRRINSSNLLLGTVILLLPTIAYASENVELLMMLGGVIAFVLGVLLGFAWIFMQTAHLGKIAIQLMALGLLLGHQIVYELLPSPFRGESEEIPEDTLEDTQSIENPILFDRDFNFS